ncbi:MAG: peptidylprolyl isomerase [Candidatus Delongbacteria bacterium]|nr:peptidylprolyl isomerase [Candidatus Delongbacteria bacterium]MBN2835534.1 peptidylprolyl isomerase [Candidatus Delongbacteria bacterium]
MANQILLKVNGLEVSEADVIIRLKSKGEYKKCLMEVVELLALKQAAKDNNIQISDEELQEFADKKRVELGLLSVADTKKYLNNLGIDSDQWADYLENELLEKIAKEKLFTEEDIKQYYQANKLNYTIVKLRKIVCEDEDTVQEIITQIGEGEDFDELAKDNSVDEATASKGGYIGVVKRGVLPVDIENRIFAAAEGELVGPFKDGNNFSVYRVDAKNIEELDDKLTKEITEGLYKYWKQNLLMATKIEAV